MNCTYDCKRTVSFVRKLSLFKSDTFQRDEIQSVRTLTAIPIP